MIEVIDKSNNPEIYDKFISKVISAIKTLLLHDDYLIQNALHETAITHRLAVYLDKEFPNYNVDCEWNKNIRETKQADMQAIVSLVKDKFSKRKKEVLSNKEPNLYTEAILKLSETINTKRVRAKKAIDLEGDRLLIFEGKTNNKVQTRLIVKNVRPDIIVHQRGQKNNRVIIEVKKEKGIGDIQYLASKIFDLVKLNIFTTDTKFDYKCGLFIEIPNAKTTIKRILVKESNVLKLFFPEEKTKVCEIAFE